MCFKIYILWGFMGFINIVQVKDLVAEHHWTLALTVTLILTSHPDFCHSVMSYSWVCLYPDIINTEECSQPWTAAIYKKKNFRSSVRVNWVKVIMRQFHCTHFTAHCPLIIRQLCLVSYYCAMKNMSSGKVSLMHT